MVGQPGRRPGQQHQPGVRLRGGRARVGRAAERRVAEARRLERRGRGDGAGHHRAQPELRAGAGPRRGADG